METTVKDVKKSFVERVMERVSGGEESKVSKFFTKTNKALDAQIKARKEQMEKLEEKISDDLSEELTESIEMVDTGAIKTVDSTDKYIQKYIQKQIEVIGKRKVVEEDLAKLKVEVEAFEEIKKEMAKVANS